jgi:hypothetical protein
VRKYFVVFRTCDVVQSLHGAPRPFGLSKLELIKVCFLSLYDALQAVPHEIHVLGDRISDELQQFFRGYPVTVSVGSYGNDASIRASFAMGMRRAPDDWVYVVEDDYLHQAHTFEYIDDLLANRDAIMRDARLEPQRRSLWLENVAVRGLARRPLFIYPPDYPDRYLSGKRRFSLIFLSRHTHWRQVGNTTFTMMAQAATLVRYRRVIDRAADGARDGYLSRKLYGNLSFTGRGLCVSPMPGLATHMHESTMTPLVDWSALCMRLRDRIREPAMT